MSRTPEALAPLPAGPPWMVQPGYPVPSCPVRQTSAPATHLQPALSDPRSARPAPPSASTLARAALGCVAESFRYLFGR